jgi:HD-GYP domain-containing protein (c-di-GMP phosphodiesterase class II)
MLREIEVGSLSLGMYVAELDRPWLETPFSLQGFYLRSPDDIRQVAEVCEIVKVDPRRYDPRVAQLSGHETGDSGDERPASELTMAPDPSAASMPEAGRDYREVTQVDEELPAARKALDASAEWFQAFWQGLGERRRVHIEQLRSAVNPLVDSILRNKDALVTLMRVQHLDRNTHEHCMALAVWGGLLGRQLGLPPQDIKSLALGCSLLDIGKIRLPKQLLYKPGTLTPGEYQIAQAHVDYSLQMLDGMGEAGEAVRNTVRWHHERMDGSGYPDGLAGADIPMFARIAGIVDSYDAMISPRVYADTCSSYEALVELQDHAPEWFQTELVEAFAQAIGLFPNGALVELSTGEVGVVCGQNPGRRLRPKVMLILDAQKHPRGELLIIDLKRMGEHEVRVARELARNEYGIEAAEYFL